MLKRTIQRAAESFHAAIKLNETISKEQFIHRIREQYVLTNNYDIEYLDIVERAQFATIIKTESDIILQGLIVDSCYVEY